MTTQPTIADFLPGTAHTTARVAALFSVTPKTVREWIKAGKLKAGTPAGSILLLIAGEEVQRAWRAMGFDPAAAGPTPTPAEEKRRADAALKRLRAKKAK